MLHLTHCRTFEVKYLGPTNHRGARVSIKDTRNNKYVYRPYSYEIGDCLEQAEKWLADKGIKCQHYSVTSNHKMFLHSYDFEHQINPGKHI